MPISPMFGAKRTVFSEKGWSGATLEIRTDTMETTLSTVGIPTTNSLQLGHVTSKHEPTLAGTMPLGTTFHCK